MKHTLLAVVAALLCAVAPGKAIPPAHAAAAAARRGVRNVLYVEANDERTGMNAVFAFRREPNGTLTPLPGSPFPTRGTGQGNPRDVVGPLDSDQDLIASADKRFLFVTNGGSNTIAVFRIARNGSLSHVPGSPFPSGGINPVSVGQARNKLYVVHRNEDEAQLPNESKPNYTGFYILPNGRLLPIPDSTIEIPVGSSPSQALVYRNNRLLFDANNAFRFDQDTGVEFGTPLLRSYRILPGGALAESTGSPLALPGAPTIQPPLPPWPENMPSVPLGLATHPRRPILYAGAVTRDSIAVISFLPATGEMTFVRALPLSGRAPCWLRMNQAGTRLYSVNTLTTSVSVIDTTDPLNPVEIQHLPLGGGGDLFNLTLDPTEKFIYVVSQRTNGFPLPGARNAIHTLAIEADGKLSLVPNSPHLLPAGETYRPQGVVAL